ncbi:MAG: small, acid-soluble spore protein, alpha/beta type [Patescibacteria group bacterium]
MAAGSSSSNTPVVLEARQALRKFRDEVANELNIDTSKIQGGYWGWVPTREAGAVGGHMVKRMIEAAERSLIEQSAAGVRTGFATGLNAPSGSVESGTNYQYNANLNLGNLGKQL